MPADSNSKGPRQWANIKRRRTRPSRATTDVSVDTSSKVGQLADSQKAYYEAKLAMDQQQHQLYVKEHAERMEVLDLQKKFYAAKLRKIAEQ